MNIYLIQLVGKWVNIMFVSALSFFGSHNISNSFSTLTNINMGKDLNVESIFTDYTTIVKYNNQLKVGEKNIIQKGSAGISYKSGQSGEIRIKDMVPEVIEQGTKVETPVKKNETSKPAPVDPANTFVGKLTGYTGNCNGCSGTVYCPPKHQKSWNLFSDGIYYKDDTYGLVRIIAAATKKFPCGTIVEISKSGKEPVIGVVLDKGGSMITAWNSSQTVWMDLAYDLAVGVDTNGLTGSNVNFKVQRWGW